MKKLSSLFNALALPIVLALTLTTATLGFTLHKANQTIIQQKIVLEDTLVQWDKTVEMMLNTWRKSNEETNATNSEIIYALHNELSAEGELWYASLSRLTAVCRDVPEHEVCNTSQAIP